MIRSSSTRSPGLAESFSLCYLWMQILKYACLRYFLRTFDLKLLLDLESRLLFGNGKNGPFHQRVHHPVLDGFSCCWGVGIEEQQWALVLAIVCMLETVKGEARLGRRNGLRELGNGARSGRFGNQLDDFGLRVDTL